jgi:hypothetical protein
MYRELSSFERQLIAILVVSALGILFAPSAIAQSGAYAAKVKFANDYNAHKYADVISDADGLKKTNSLDEQSMQVVAQAYYLSGNKAGCMKYIQENFGASANEKILELQKRCSK